MFNVKKQSNFSLFFVIFLTSFLLGIIFSFILAKKLNYDLLKNEKGTDIINLLKNDNDLELEKFWETYSLLKKEYYSNNSIKKYELVDWAIKWMVESLWDKHSEFMTVEETERFNQALSWDFEGIWAVVEKSPLWVQIERIIKWSPAKKYGLIKWDIIIEANWIKLEEMDLFDSVDKIKWPAWTKVLLKILRIWETEVLEIEVTRDRIKIPSVDSNKIEGTNIWYIALNMFWEDTDTEFEKALDFLKDTDWIIIDLRDNGWGYLQKAVNVLSELVDDWENLVFTKYRQLFNNIVYKSINDWDIYDWKIVVLINWNSASASEITAWALSDHNKAIIVWEKSYWKWSVQQPFDITWGWLLKLTIAKWYTPNDINIDKEWITPDIEIKFEKEDYENEYDRQLETSKEILQDFIKLWSLQLTIDKYLNK